MELVSWNTDSMELNHGSKQTAIYIMQLKFIDMINNLFKRNFQCWLLFLQLLYFNG